MFYNSSRVFSVNFYIEYTILQPKSTECSTAVIVYRATEMKEEKKKAGQMVATSVTYYCCVTQ